MLEPVEPIYINGETQLAKRRGTDITVPVSNNAATERSKHISEKTKNCPKFILTQTLGIRLMRQKNIS